MKTLVSTLIIALSLFLSPNISDAELTELNNTSGHVVYDTITQQAWIWDFNTFNNMTYQEQISNIRTDYANTNYFNTNTWHMASLPDMQNLWNYSLEELKIFNEITLRPDQINLHPVGSSYRGGRFDLIYTYVDGFHSTAFVMTQVSNGQLVWVKTPLIHGGAGDSLDDNEFGAWVVSNPFHYIPPVPKPSTKFEFNYEFSNGTSPLGLKPWLTSEFVKNADGTVELVLKATGLTGSEFIGDLFFNLDPSLITDDLKFTYLEGIAASSIEVGRDAFKADGDGYYDIAFHWDANLFGADGIVKYLLGYSDLTSLSEKSFSFLSEPGGGNGTYYSAAHVQGIGVDGEGSGWIAPAPVPEPSTMLLLGSGLLGLVGYGRKRLKK